MTRAIADRRDFSLLECLMILFGFPAAAKARWARRRAGRTTP